MFPVERVKQCSRCKTGPSKPGQRYCRSCHASYMRSWRAKKPSARSVKRAQDVAAIRAMILDYQVAA